MKAVNSVIIRSDNSYNNKIGDYTVNVSIDNVESINRTAVVVVAPIGSGLSQGDEVLVHHNIMRENIHNSGYKTSSQFHIADSYYRCPISEVLMRKKEGEWVTLLNFVFLEPIKQEDIDIGNGMILSPHSRKGMQDLRATLSITNKNLRGVDVGDTVVFTRNSEHEFIIDSVKMYKCEVEDILAKL